MVAIYRRRLLKKHWGNRGNLRDSCLKYKVNEMSDEELFTLLQRQWTGQITAEEIDKLEAYLSRNPQAASIAESYRLVWEKAAMPAVEVVVDLDEEFRRLVARIEAAEKAAAGTFTVVRPFARWWRAAAAVALIGVVLWQLWPSKADAPIWKQVTAAVDGYEVVLPDQSTVVLRQGATLAYSDETYGRPERRVRLQGEALFTVQHLSSQPLIVEAVSGSEIEVVGTKFNVRSDSHQTEVLVCDGKVHLWPNGVGRGTPTLLEAYEKAYWDGTLRKEKTAHLNDIAWYTHQMAFKSEPLEKALQSLALYYKATLETQRLQIPNCPYSGNISLSRQRWEDVLRSVEKIYRVRWKRVSSGAYRLEGGECPLQ